MTRTMCLLLMLGVIVASAMAFPAEDWVAYRSYGASGGSASWSR